MPTMKDKLANSVRQAKSAAVPAAKQSRTAKRAAPARTPAVPAAPRQARAATPPANQPAADAQGPASSAKDLFPRRVWPD